VHTVRKPGDVEIDQKPDRNIQEFHIAQELCFVDWQDCLHRLPFDQNAALDENIEAQSLVARKALVSDCNQPLIFSREFSELKLAQKTPLVNGFDQAGSLVLVNFNCRANDPFG